METETTIQILLVIAYFLLSLIVSCFAYMEKKDVAFYYFISMVLTPIIGGLILYFSRDEVENEQIEISETIKKKKDDEISINYFKLVSH